MSRRSRPHARDQLAMRVAGINRARRREIRRKLRTVAAKESTR